MEEYKEIKHIHQILIGGHMYLTCKKDYPESNSLNHHLRYRKGGVYKIETLDFKREEVYIMTCVGPNNQPIWKTENINLLSKYFMTKADMRKEKIENWKNLK